MAPSVGQANNSRRLPVLRPALLPPWHSQERLKSAGRVYASVLLAEGRLYAVSREKGTWVLAAQPEFKQLAHNVFESDSSIFNGSPAILGSNIYLRSDEKIYCIGGDKKKSRL